MTDLLTTGNFNVLTPATAFAFTLWPTARIVMLYNTCFAVCNFLFAQFAGGMHSTRWIILCLASHTNFINHSSLNLLPHAQLSNLWCICWLNKSAYLDPGSVFSKLLSSLPVSFSAYLMYTLTRKITKHFLHSFNTNLLFLFALCNITNSLVWRRGLKLKLLRVPN